MQYRNLGRSGLKVSPICLGTMMFGGPTDEATSSRIIDKAREAGINFIDTADVYNGGDSEAVVGRAIADRPRQLGSRRPSSPTRSATSPTTRGLSRRWMLQAAEDSLKRLGTDYIDIYYLHKEDHATPLEETVRALGDLMRAGQDPLFRRLELPRLAHRRDLHICDDDGIDRPVVSQPLYNAVNRMPEVEQLPACGLLRPRRRALQPAGARRADRQVPAGRRARRGHPRRPRRQAHHGDRVAAGIAAASRRRSSSMPKRAASPPGQFAVAWVLNNALVTRRDRRSAHRGAMGRLPQRAGLSLHGRGRGADRSPGGDRPSVDAGLQRSRLSDRGTPGADRRCQVTPASTPAISGREWDAALQAGRGGAALPDRTARNGR